METPGIEAKRKMTGTPGKETQKKELGSTMREMKKMATNIRTNKICREPGSE